MYCKIHKYTELIINQWCSGNMKKMWIDMWTLWHGSLDMYCCHQISGTKLYQQGQALVLHWDTENELPNSPGTLTTLLFPILTGGTRVFQSHIKSGSGSHVKHWCLDCSSPMKGSEASSVTHILSSLCLVPVSLQLPCWHRTITSQRYFLNVSSGAKRFPVGAQQPGCEGGTPVIAHAEPQHKRATGSSPRAGGCRCQSQWWWWQ